MQSDSFHNTSRTSSRPPRSHSGSRSSRHYLTGLPAAAGLTFALSKQQSGVVGLVPHPLIGTMRNIYLTLSVSRQKKISGQSGHSRSHNAAAPPPRSGPQLRNAAARVSVLWKRAGQWQLMRHNEQRICGRNVSEMKSRRRLCAKRGIESA
jgi:hypothetical protein